MNPPLLITINCSIGDKSRHLSIDGLCDLLLNIKEKENHLSPLEKYAISMLQKEALPKEIEWFERDYYRWNCKL